MLPQCLHLRVCPSGAFLPGVVVQGIGPQVFADDLSNPVRPWAVAVRQPVEEVKAGGVLPATGGSQFIIPEPLDWSVTRRPISSDAKVLLLNDRVVPEVGVVPKKTHQLAAVPGMAQFLHLQMDHVAKHVFILVIDYGQHLGVVHNGSGPEARDALEDGPSAIQVRLLPLTDLVLEPSVGPAGLGIQSAQL